MLRPVRPMALLVLTACALYPGLTFVYQGLYAFVAGYHFQLLGDYGPWVNWAIAMGLHPIVAWGAKTLVGLMWLAGVPGLWAGDGRAYPVVLGAAVLSAAYPGGPMVMGILGLICLLGFREKPTDIPV